MTKSSQNRLTGARGIVVQAVGMGNMNAMKYALSKGVPVVISTTRAHNGRTYLLYGF